MLADLETSTMTRPRLDLCCCATEIQKEKTWITYKMYDKNNFLQLHCMPPN
jgi:hypothetical protein